MAIGMIESCPGKVHTKGIAGGFFCNSSGRQPFFGMHHAAHTSFVMRFTRFSLP